MKNCLCVDIGSSCLKLASPEKSGAEAVAETPDNLVRDGSIHSYEAAAAFLTETAKNRRFPKEAAVLLPSSKVYVRQLTLPVMTPEQLKLNLPFEFRDYIGDDKASWFFDYAVMRLTDGPDGKSPEMELLAAAAQKATVNSYVQMFRQAGFKLIEAAPEEMGYCALVRDYIEHNPAAADGVFCFVDLGHNATRFHVLNGFRYVTSRVIETGGSQIDAAIAETHGVDAHVAHDYKLQNLENCLTDPACRSVYEQIGVEIMRAVNFYTYNNPDSVLDTLYLCGGGANIEPLAREIAAQNPELHIRRAEELYPAGLAQKAAALSPAALGLSME